MKQTGAPSARPFRSSLLPSYAHSPRTLAPELTYQEVMRRASEAHAQREQRYKAKLVEVLRSLNRHRSHTTLTLSAVLVCYFLNIGCRCTMRSRRHVEYPREASMVAAR